MERARPRDQCHLSFKDLRGKRWMCVRVHHSCTPFMQAFEIIAVDFRRAVSSPDESRNESIVFARKLVA